MAAPTLTTSTRPGAPTPSPGLVAPMCWRGGWGPPRSRGAGGRGGGPVVDPINAGGDGDTVTGAGGADVLAGGLGTDTIKESSTAIVLQDASLSVGGVADTTFGGFEDADLDGTAGVHTFSLTGWAGTSAIDTLAGADVITGGS